MKNVYTKITILLILVITTQVTALGVPNGVYVSGGPADIQFQLVDPLGNKTGYDPSINNIIEKIPNTMYKSQQLTTISDKPWGDAYHRLEPIHNSASYFLSTGKYQLIIYGTNITKQFLFDISIPYYDNNMDLIYPATKKTIYQNVTWTYEFDVPIVPPANGQIILTKVSTSADLIKDLTTAGQLGYIGNAKFVTELTKEINEIEAEKAKGKIDDGLTPAQKAKKEYTELFNEITEKYNKPEADEFVRQEAYDVLKEDLEYIINYLGIWKMLNYLI